MVRSRSDVGARPPGHGGGSSAAAPDGLCTVVRTLPKVLRGPAGAARYVDRTLARLLGGEGSDRSLSDRGDRSLRDDSLPQRAVGLLLHREVCSGCDDDGVGESSESESGAYEVEAGALDSYLTLDRTAAEAVNLLPPLRGSGTAECVVGGKESNNSVYGVLNRCRTRMGPRTLELWLRQPLVDLEELRRRQRAVSVMVEDSIGRDRLRDEGLGALTGVDLDRMCVGLAAHAADAGDGNGAGTGSASSALQVMYKMHAFADAQLPALTEALSDLLGDDDGDGDGDAQAEEKKGSDGDDAEKNDDTLRLALSGLRKVAVNLDQASKLVEAVLDFDSAPREFLVRPDFNDDLRDIRTELDSLQSELDECHGSMNDLWADIAGGKKGKSGQVRLEMGERKDSGGSGTSFEWQFRLPDTNDIKLLQKRMGDEVQVHKILKNGVYFSNRDLRQLATKKHDLLTEYQVKQREIASRAAEVAATYVPVLERASFIVSELDVLASLAHVAATSPHGYCLPIMTDGEEDGLGIELKAARHPCVELQDDVDYIPNDVSLKFGESSFLVVTGPNMGGKSTYIRSLGAIVAMAQIGSYVPCAEARINIVHHILARVGAGDVQDRGISTFMAEMLEASSILRTATKRSLIVVDELGRGTSTFDGYGLARAISEYVAKEIGCMTVFATHFHELTALEEREGLCVKNAHVSARKSSSADGSSADGLTFLYEVRDGPCLESFGIQVAEMAGVPSLVVRDARRKAKQLENFDYRKKKMRRKDGMGKEEVTSRNAGSAEDTAFVDDFRAIPLLSFDNPEEKKRAFMALMKRHA